MEAIPRVENPTPRRAICLSNGLVYGSVFIILAAIVITACYRYWQSEIEERIHQRLLLDDDGKEVLVVARIEGAKRHQTGIDRYQISIESYLAASDVLYQNPRHLRVSHYPKQEETCLLPSGARVLMRLRLRAVRSFYNPEGFDYEYWALLNGIDATGYVKGYSIIGASAEAGPLARKACLSESGVKNRVFMRAYQLPGLAGQVVPALLFGDTQSLEGQYWQQLQLTGTVHLLVVSGLHLGFWVLFVLLVWRLGLRLLAAVRGVSSNLLVRLEPIILLLVIAVYCWLAGWGISLQRAFLMLMLVVVYRYTLGRIGLLPFYLLALLFGFALSPLSVGAAGFIYSYSAVAALLLAFSGRQVQPRFGNTGRLVRVQVILALILTPLYWWFLQPQSFHAVLINLLAVPLLGMVILPLSIAVYLFPLAELVELYNWILSALFDLLAYVAAGPKSLHYSIPGFWLWLLWVAGFLWIVLRGLGFRAPVLILLAVLLVYPVRHSATSLQVFDVGQGLSALVRTAEYSFLYDTGARYESGFSLGGRVVAPNLRAQGVQQVDTLVVSHEDNDHAGGLAELARYVGFRRLLVGQRLGFEGERLCGDMPEEWQSDAGAGLRWRILKQPIEQSSDNNRSCVVQLEVAGRRILFTGDIERSVELDLVQRFGAELKSDILIVGHHGSRTSSSLPWLRFVAPELAIVSAGYNHRYGHPHSDVVERIEQAGAVVLNTAQHGAVEVRIEDCDQMRACFRIINWRTARNAMWRQK